jgi:hypothetical protein
VRNDKLGNLFAQNCIDRRLADWLVFTTVQVNCFTCGISEQLPNPLHGNLISHERSPGTGEQQGLSRIAGVGQLHENYGGRA